MKTKFREVINNLERLFPLLLLITCNIIFTQDTIQFLHKRSNTNMKRNSLQEDQHLSIIKLISERLLSSGYSVLADHINWRYGRPLPINEQIPDIFAFNAYETIIYEVQTKDTFQTRYALEKLYTFSRNPNIRTYLVLPTSFGLNEHIPKAKELLRGSKLNVHLVTCDLKRNDIKFY